MKTLMILGAACLSMVAAAVAQPYASWDRYREVTINTTNANGGANVAEAVENFPVLVRLSTFGGAATGGNVLTEALAGGADVRFTTADGSTALPYQIDYWGESSAAIWVRVPTVAGNANTTIRMYWGRAGETSASNGAAVFDTAAGFTGAWHLHQNGGGTGNVLDATANELHFNGHENVPAVPGVIGNARHYNASEEDNTFWVDNFTGAANATKAQNFVAAGTSTFITISAWVNPQFNSGQDIQGIFGHYRYNTNNRSYHLSLAGNPAGAVRINTSANGTADRVVQTTGTPLANLNQWYHVMMTIESGVAANQQIKVYVNGEAQAMANHATQGIFAGSVANNADRPFIGAMNTQWNHRFGGFIDELQFSNGVARSADWAKLSYETQKPGASAVTLGATVAPGRALYYPLKNAVYLLNTAIDANTPVTSGAVTGNFAITPTSLPAGLSFNASTGAITGTPTATTTTAQEYRVTATVGGNAASDTITISVTAGTPPNPPTNVTGVMSSGQVQVSWSAPLVTGSAPITSYVVRAVEDTSKTCTWTTGDLTCAVTGLTNGTAYTFTVRAISGAGSSDASAPSVAITPAGRPVAPTGVQVELLSGAGQNATATVSWTAPTSDGGLPISGTFVFGEPSGACFAPAPNTSCTVSGLAYGTPYTFRAAASNSVGIGDTSAASAAFTPVSILPGSFVLQATGSAQPFTFVLSQDAIASTDAFTMTISDVWGRTVWSRTVHPARDGSRELTWNSRNTSGQVVSSGMYVVRVTMQNGANATNFIERTVKR